MTRCFASFTNLTVALAAIFLNLSFAQAETSSVIQSSRTLAVPVYGWVEAVRIYPNNMRLKAKLDTGAKTSSLHALNIKEITRGNDTWVSFSVPTQDENKKIRFELKVQRFVRIKRHNGKFQRRPVVNLDICLGKALTPSVEFSLIDRSEFNYPVLLGRNFLEGNSVVDAARSFTREPDCKSKKP